MIVSYKTPVLEDYSNVKSIWEDPETMGAVGGVYHLPKEKYPMWLDSMTNRHKDRNCYFLIISGDQCVGEVSFHRFDKNSGKAELNIKVKADHRKKGIGRNALDHILDIFFNDWDGREMLDLIREGNQAGLAALKAYGFKERVDEEGDMLLYMSREMYREINSVINENNN